MSATQLPDHTEDAVPYEEHIGGSRQYLRDIILGVNDGLVSILLLVAGVVGGGLDATQVLLTAVAGALAGAVSMASGEYLATKSQEELFQAEMRLEEHHLEHHREIEQAELYEMFGDMGIGGEDLDTLVGIIDKHDTAMMKVMAGLEFGVVDAERRNPYMAALASGVFFLAGSLPSILPFIFVDDTTTGLVAAGILAGTALFIVGVFKTLLTRTNPVISGLENLAIGLGGGVVAFLVGRGFDALISS